MSGTGERIVLCEGYHDRAFIAGALEKMGCTESRTDGQGKTVSGGGQYGFRSATNQFIRVVPCQGKEKIPVQLRSTLDGRGTRGFIKRIVVCIDADTDSTAGLQVPMAPQWVGDATKTADPNATLDAYGDWRAFDGDLVVSVATWWTNDPPTDELPHKQTLERMIVAALRSSNGRNARMVADWLANVGNHGPKEYAWSHMAGWHAEEGCEGFCRLVWKNIEVAQELMNRFKVNGCARIFDKLTR